MTISYGMMDTAKLLLHYGADIGRKNAKVLFLWLDLCGEQF